MPDRLRVVVTGLIGQHASMGGMTWHHLQYVLGLARLGHDVYYVEGARLNADSDLKREYEAAGPVVLPLVHPRRFVEWVEWGLGLCGGEPSTAARAV